MTAYRCWGWSGAGSTDGSARRDEEDEPPFSLHAITPPYTYLRLGGQRVDPTPGLVLAIRLDSLQASNSIQDLISPDRLRDVQREFSFAPIVAITAPGASPEVFFYLGATGFAGVLRKEKNLVDQLRAVISTPPNLPARIADLVSLCRPRLDPRITLFLNRVLTLAPHFPTAGEVLRRLSEPEGYARRRLARAGLPLTGDWVQFGRCIHVILLAQQWPKKPLSALTSGVYSHQSVFSRQCVRLLGTRPSEIRRTLGWQWWTAAFLERCSVNRGEEVDRSGRVTF